MKVYSRRNTYLLSKYLLLIGRVAFFVGLFFLGLSLYFGDVSENIENSITPHSDLGKAALVIWLIWILSIICGFIVGIFLSCDKCCSRLCFHPHGYRSATKRNWMVAFFIEDDVYEKKFICFKCNTEYEL